MIIFDNNPYIQPSFTLSNRFLRFLWGIVWLFLFRTSPRYLHGWRSFLLRCFGARLGRHVHVYPEVRIWAPWHLDIGSHVGIGQGAQIYNMASIRINDFAVISQGAHLCAGSHDYNSPNFQLVAKPIEIGAHAWVAADAFVGPGVSVPEGAVIGARAVVSKSPPTAWGVYAGNPARFIKHRTRHLHDHH